MRTRQTLMRAVARSKRPGSLLAVLALVVAAIAGACGSAAPSGPASTGGPSASSAALTSSPVLTLTWRSCGGAYECARLAVPLDYAAPSGSTIDIFMARLPASDQAHRIGSLLVNLGGPGGPGIPWLQNDGAAALPAEVRARFDIVAFDPRGTGLSSPVSCLGDAAMDAMRAVDPIAHSTAERDALLASAAAFAAACEAKSGAVLPFVSTESTARDLDRIRAALGEKELSYIGYSYGTYLGARYATLFPGNVRALVLDSAIDSTVDPLTLAEEQAKAIEAALDRFLDDCGADATCAFNSGGDPAGAFDALMQAVEQKPIAAGAGRTLGYGDAVTGVASLLKAADWAGLATGLANARGGNGSTLLAAADGELGRNAYGQYDSFAAASAAIHCLDIYARYDVATLDRLATRLASVAPRTGRGYPTHCQSWPVRAASPPAAVVAPSGTSLLVIGLTGDPATPYAWSERMVRTLGNATLLTVRAEGHTLLTHPENACAADAVARYLVDLEVPAAGLTC